MFRFVHCLRKDSVKTESPLHCVLSFWYYYLLRTGSIWGGGGGGNGGGWRGRAKLKLFETGPEVIKIVHAHSGEHEIFTAHEC